ncbi:hypothetical protein OBBRIDRAFT_808313 [Obba rivulosa]|uniref:Uncharacterized protein n=1 Tax=Obba rivulosa TaxID=1052685 RepID=A0A8E2AH41_9APHY|nr:hypothetical protein OBBRIDRAFT_808313 [Obba rivulosa]
MYYALHVQSLSIEYSECFPDSLSAMRVFPGVYMTLCAHKPGARVLPNLSELSWWLGSSLDRQVDDLHFLRLTLGLRLSTLTIKCSSKLDDALVPRRPNAPEHSRCRSAPAAEAASTAGVLDVHRRGRPHVRSDSAASFPASDTPCGHVPTATFVAERVADSAPVLKLTAASRLEYFHIDALSAPRATELRQLFSDVAKDHSDSLDALIITSLTGAPRSDRSYTITSAVLQPLFALKYVVHVSIVARCTVQIDDATVQGIAKAWPQIRILNLGIHGRRPSHAHPISEAYDEQNRLLDCVCSRSLSGLRVSTSKVPERKDDVEILTRFLADVFPKLKKIHSAWINSLDRDAVDREQDFEDAGWDKEWVEVERSPIEMSAVQELERRQVAPRVEQA